MASKKKKGSGSKRRKDIYGNILYPGEYYYPSKDIYEYKFKNILNKTDSRSAKTLDELRQLEEIIQAEHSHLLISGNAEITVADMVEIYLRSKKNIEKTTLTGYWNNYRWHIKDTWFGAMAIGKVLKLHVANYYNELIESRGLARGTIETINHIVAPSFRLAIDSRWITYNPCILVMKDIIHTEEKEKTVLSKKQQIQFFQYIKKHYRGFDYNLLYTMTFFGLRVGETIGINKKELDFENKKFDLMHQVIYKKLYDDECTKFRVRPPKTMNGIRYMYFDDEEILQCLHAQIEYANYITQTKGSCIIDDERDFLFITAKGNPITPGSINRLIDNIVKRYNKEKIQQAIKNNEEATDLLPHLSCHSLRRTGLTRMAESGMSPQVLQLVAGHSKIEITLQYYVKAGNDVVKDEMLSYAKSLKSLDHVA